MSSQPVQYRKCDSLGVLVDVIEEGEWTPALVGSVVPGFAGAPTCTYAAGLFGAYALMGSGLAYLNGFVALTAKGTTSGTIGITGLPVWPSQLVDSGGVISYWGDVTFPVATVQLTMFSTGFEVVPCIQFQFQSAAGAAGLPMTDADIGDDFYVAFNMLLVYDPSRTAP